MKLAIAHDFVRHGGAEKVLEQMHALWPTAPVYTLLAEDNPQYLDWDIRSSRLQGWLPPSKYRWPLPFYPGMVDRLPQRIDWDIDLLISSSVSLMKNLRVPAHIPHLCCIYRPAMFAYDRQDEFLAGYPAVFRPLLRNFSAKFRSWDQAGSNNPDLYVACSKYVASKVKEYYRQQAKVVYPPVETAAFCEAGKKTERGDYYLTALRLESYKRAETVVEACTRLKLPLKVAGTGPMRRELENIAGPSVEFLGFVHGTEMPALVAGCRTFLFPSEEDFGIAPVEALAAGRPVIAYGAAGALETVSDGETGIHYPHQSTDALVQAIQREQEVDWDEERLRASAERFSTENFRTRFHQTVESLLADWKPPA